MANQKGYVMPDADPLFDIPAPETQSPYTDSKVRQSRSMLVVPMQESICILNDEQRRKWGVCPICHSEAGISCVGDAQDVHIPRLDAAPLRVRIGKV